MVIDPPLPIHFGMKLKCFFEGMEDIDPRTDLELGGNQMITDTMGTVGADFLVQAGAALLAWGFLACASYVCTVWCFSYQMDWYRAVRSAGILIGGLGSGLGIFYLFSAQWAEITTTIILPAVVCVCALHALLLMLKDFLAQRAQLLIHEIRFYTTLALLYALFVSGAAFIIHLKNPYLTECFTLSLNYFIYAAVLAIFGLSLCNHRHGNSY
jgi:hypothetical protein